MINKFVEWLIKITDDEFEKCKKFADESAKTQRGNRSGGSVTRNENQISSDTLRGKIGEIAVKKFLEQDPLDISDTSLDFGIYPRGIWDEHDLKIYGKTFSIKSSKHFSKYLLLETKDIGRGSIFDYYVLVLVNAEYKTGEIVGFVSKDEMEQISDKTLDLKKGQCIPNTKVPLDADNHARHKDHLHNSEVEWIDLIKKLN